MADISKITLPSGSTYDIKDAKARADIAALSAYTDYLGVTTTVLTDGVETNPIKINNEDKTAVKGNIVTYNKKEFIFNGTEWQEFGDLSGLGSLAYKNSASGSYTPAGTVSQPIFSGTAVEYTPAGTISAIAHTPAGSVSSTFRGETTNVSVTGSGTVQPASSGVTTYTPAGNVTAPSITVTPTTSSVNSMTGVGTLPSLTTSVSNETLTIAFAAGSLPTMTSKTVMTGASASASAPAFNGTGVRLVTSEITSSGACVPQAEVSSSFSGTAFSVTPTFTGTKGSITAAGTVSKPTFTGSNKTVTVQ